MSEFRQPALKELTEQLAGTDKRKSLVPVGKRRAQFERAGQLLAEVASPKNYPYPFVCYRVTGFRSDAYPDLLVPGEDLRHDLKLLYERLDRSLPALPIEQAAEPLLTLAQVSRLLKVSAKTVRRWKTSCDLVGRRVLVNGRRHLGFPEAAVAQFVAAHRGRVDRGGRFTHLSETEKTEILTHARLLARGGGSLTDVSRRVARMLGRSAEAVRYTIRNFDRAHPAQTIFPDLTGPLDRPTKQMIFNSYRRGIPVNALAKRFRRTRTSMYRVISEVRAEQLMKQAQDYIYNPSFDEKSMEVVILGPIPGLPEFEKQRTNMRVSIAKRRSGQTDHPLTVHADGNRTLMRAVAKVDYGRGNSYSTYASCAIMQNSARSLPEEKHPKERHATGRDEIFDVAPHIRTD